MNNYEIIYKGEKIIKPSKTDMVMFLRTKKFLSYADIGDLVGLTRQRIGQILQDQNLAGNVEYAMLNNPDIYEQYSDEEIAEKYDIIVYTVTRARKILSVDKKRKVNLERRRKHFVKFIYGAQYLPGRKFKNLKEILKPMLTDKQMVAVDDFYIQGLEEALSENINSDHMRVFRHTTNKRVRNIGSLPEPEKLIGLEILEYASSVKSN